jgi:hypothetical protein
VISTPALLLGVMTIMFKIIRIIIIIIRNSLQYLFKAGYYGAQNAYLMSGVNVHVNVVA